MWYSGSQANLLFTQTLIAEFKKQLRVVSVGCHIIFSFSWGVCSVFIPCRTSSASSPPPYDHQMTTFADPSLRSLWVPGQDMGFPQQLGKFLDEITGLTYTCIRINLRASLLFSVKILVLKNRTGTCGKLLSSEWGALTSWQECIDTFFSRLMLMSNVYVKNGTSLTLRNDLMRYWCSTPER